MELGWRVGDGGDWHHDQIWVDAGLVSKGILHGSAGVKVSDMNTLVDSLYIRPLASYGPGHHKRRPNEPV